MSSSERQEIIRCAVIGVGRMGRHHARVYHQLDGADFVGVIDQDKDRATRVASEHGGRVFNSIRDLIESGVDAVTIAAPTNSHRAVAEPLLHAGVACLVEKPLAPNVKEAEAIARLADETGAVLQVGHIERYNPAVRAIAAERNLRPRFIEVHRVSPMSFRSVDVGVVLDMMIHDLDVLLMLTEEEPVRVQACAVAVLGAAEDVCNARLEFPSGCVANVTASRLAMKTERKMRIIADDAYISVDYGKKTGIMIRRTANERQLAELREQLAAGKDLSDLDYTQLVNVDPLQVSDEDQLVMELSDFLAAVREGKRPTVDVHAGFAAVRTAERIVDSAREHAQRIS